MVITWSYPSHQHIINFQLIPQDVLDIELTRFGYVRVFDVSGKEVYRTSSFNAPTEIDLSALTNGIYTIQLTNKGGVFTGKVVRE